MDENINSENKIEQTAQPQPEIPTPSKLDLPRGVIVVLVVLSVVISVLGSWTVMQESKRVEMLQNTIKGTPTQVGEISVGVLPPDPSAAVTGKVVLNVERNTK